MDGNTVNKSRNFFLRQIYWEDKELRSIFHLLLNTASVWDMLPSETAHSILTALLQSSLTVGTNLSLCNFHPQILILSLGTTQKRPNPSSSFHMSALQIFEYSYQVSHDCCGRLNTGSPKDVYVLISKT